MLHETLGAGDLIVLIDEDHLKAAVGAPVAERLALAHDEERRGQTVRQSAVLAYDRNGGEGIVDGVAGLGIYQVVVGLAVLREVALVGAAGDDGGLTHADDAEVA